MIENYSFVATHIWPREEVTFKQKQMNEDHDDAETMNEWVKVS